MAPKTGKKQHAGQKRALRRPHAPHRDTRDGDQGKGKSRSPKPPQNGFFIWGRHAVTAALANPERRIAALYATDEAAAELSGIIEHLPAARQNEIPRPTITLRPRLDDINRDETGEKIVHQGMVAAVWPLEAAAIEDIIAATGDGPVRLILLDQLSDPRNVGAIMRSARAFGVTAMITTHRNAPEESGGLARTAAGALEHVPLVRVVNLARAIELLQQADISVVGLAGDGDIDVGKLSDFPRLALVLGAEGAGLRRLTREHCDHLARIDINADADSLNVSNAAAVALYAARQVPSAR